MAFPKARRDEALTLRSRENRRKARAGRLAGLAIVVTLGSVARGIGGNWQYEVVDPAGAGRHFSLRIDRQGNGHLAYISNGTNQLKYAFFDQTQERWFTMVVDEQAEYSSLALDSQQRPHISYTSFGGGNLKYAHFDGTEWKKQIVQLNSQMVSYFTSIALDPQDRPSISFYEYRGASESQRLRLRNVMWNGQYWEARTVDGSYGSGKFNAMAADAQGRFHLAYGNVSGDGGIRYALWDGTAWKAEVIEGAVGQAGEAFPAYSVFLALDSKGVPHIVYTTFVQPYRIKYATRENGEWKTERVGTIGDLGAYGNDRNGIAVDEEGRPYITYFDGAQSLLRLAYRDGERWVSEVVDNSFGGLTSSVQVGSGTIWVAYSDDAAAIVKVARREVPVASPATRKESEASDRAAVAAQP